MNQRQDLTLPNNQQIVASVDHRLVLSSPALMSILRKSILDRQSSNLGIEHRKIRQVRLVGLPPNPSVIRSSKHLSHFVGCTLKCSIN